MADPPVLGTITDINFPGCLIQTACSCLAGDRPERAR